MEEKPDYEFRPGDWVPFWGMLRYATRNEIDIKVKGCNNIFFRQDKSHEGKGLKKIVTLLDYNVKFLVTTNVLAVYGAYKVYQGIEAFLK